MLHRLPNSLELCYIAKRLQIISALTVIHPFVLSFADPISGKQSLRMIALNNIIIIIKLHITLS